MNGLERLRRQSGGPGIGHELRSIRVIACPASAARRRSSSAPWCATARARWGCQSSSATRSLYQLDQHRTCARAGRRSHPGAPNRRWMAGPGMIEKPRMPRLRSTTVTAAPTTMTGFADLGLRRRAAQRADRPRLRGADADPARGDPAAARGPRPARPGRHRHRQDGRVRAAAPAAARRGDRRRPAPVGAGPRAHPRAGHAGLRGGPPLRPRPRRARAADLRRRSRSAGSCGRSSAASTSSSPRPGRALDHIGRGTLRLDERRDRRARRGRRDARHGLRRGHRGDPRRDARRRGRPCCSRRRCRRGSTRIARRHLSDPVRIEIGRETAAPGEAPLVRQTAYVVPARAQAGRARPGARRRGARPRRSSSAAPATRSTSSPRRSTAAATAPRRCTAA